MRMIALITLVFIFSSVDAAPVRTINPMMSVFINNPVTFDSLVARFSSMKIKELERLTGKKFNLKEKLAIKIYQAKVKKELRKTGKNQPQSKKGKTSLTLGILSVVAALGMLLSGWFLLLALPLAITAIVTASRAEKESPGDKNAKAGSLLGWISLGLILVATIIVFILVVSFANAFD